MVAIVRDLFGDPAAPAADNVHDFAAKAKERAAKAKSGAGETANDQGDNPKANKEDVLIENYVSHLNSIIKAGSYAEFLEPNEIVKMAQIGAHFEKSKHSRIEEVRELFNKAVNVVRTTSSALILLNGLRKLMMLFLN